MSKQTGCLIIHGLNGILEEIQPLNEYLINKGFQTACPILKGHGMDRRQLSGIKYSEWISSAEEELIKLSAKCDKIFLIGFSMGALIAVHLALKYKITGIITLNMPIYHWDFKRIFLNILNDLRKGKMDSIRFYTRASSSLPISAMYNFKVLLIKTKPLLKQIECPIFIAQGLLDDTVHQRSAKYIFNYVASQRKVLKYYKNSNHIICLSPDAQELFEKANGFMNVTIKHEI